MSRQIQRGDPCGWDAKIAEEGCGDKGRTGTCGHGCGAGKEVISLHLLGGGFTQVG